MAERLDNKLKAAGKKIEYKQGFEDFSSLVNDITGTNGAEYTPTGVPAELYEASGGFLQTPRMPNMPFVNLPDSSTMYAGATSIAQGLGSGAGVGQKMLTPGLAGAAGFAEGIKQGMLMAKQQKQDMLTAYDLAPISTTYPKLAKEYPELAGMPTSVARDLIGKLTSAKISARQTKEAAQLTKQDAEEVAGLANKLDVAGRTDWKADDFEGMDQKAIIDLINLHADQEKIKALRGAQGAVPVDLKSTELKADPALAKEYGVPQAIVNPYRGLNAKAYEKVSQQEFANTSKQVERVNEAASMFTGTIGELEKAKALLDSGLNTGIVIGKVPLVARSTDAQEFDQLSKTFLPKMRQGMPGAVSDRDMKIFQSANFGLEKDENVNRDIINRGIAVAKRNADYARFISNYNTVYGTTKGADSEWKRYTIANPLFDSAGKAIPNVMSFEDYFRGGKTSEQPVQTPQAKTTKPMIGF